jgi:tetratricopeptide (TPR) repeat protein
VLWGALEEGNYKRCIQVADKLLAHKENVYTMSARRCALVELGRYREAEQQLLHALELSPSLDYTYIQLSRALAGQKRFAEAEAVLIGALEEPRMEGGSESLLFDLSLIWATENRPGEKLP